MTNPSVPPASSPTVPATVPTPPNQLRTGAMLFRILAPHVHQAVLGNRVFSCERETTVTDNGVSIRWSATEGKKVLQLDCRTLNEAKNVCRVAAGADHAKPALTK